MNNQAALGDFIFSVQRNVTYDSLVRVSDGGWVSVDRVNRFPASQTTGRGLDTLTLSGSILGAGGQAELDKLRALQALEQPQSLIDGSGAVLGQWKIMKVTERQGRIIDDGNSLSTEFTLDLEKYEQ